MILLKNRFLQMLLDPRWPRIVWYASPDGRTRIPGEREAVAPRVYVFRKRDRAQLSSDDDVVQAEYSLSASVSQAVYRARVTCDGRLAVEFDVVLSLAGPDAQILLDNVREQPGYCLLSVRFQRVIAASSRDPDGRVLTCFSQGRVLDPAKCQPNMIDYNWHGTTARPCGAAYRERFMVTIDIPGYENLFINEVRQYSRIGYHETLASIGTELMYRRRTVEDPEQRLRVPPGKRVPVATPGEPVPSAEPRQIRLHVLAARAGRPLDWTDAAKYFQSKLVAGKRCHPLYNDTLISKACVFWEPTMTFEQALEAIRRLYHLTDGMKHVCYFTGFQHQGGDSGRPDMLTINPAYGDRRRLRRVIREARQWNVTVSFHDNQSQVDVAWREFDWDMVARDSLGRPFSGGLWGECQLLQISMPQYVKTLKKVIPRVLRAYGIRQTYHLDTMGGPQWICDTHPHRRFNATQCHEANFELLKEYNRHGIDVTGEIMIDPYVGRLGHAWCLFNYGTTWRGEERVPFANFIYHGATSWNAGHAEHRVTFFAEKYSFEDTLLGMLHQGGGVGLTIPFHLPDLPETVDLLYLVQPPYLMLRNRKWTGFRQTGSVRRVDYASTKLSTSASTRLGTGAPATGARGGASFIAVDPARPGYEVVVDGRLIAKDFVTVFPGWKPGTLLAFSRHDTELDWPAPQGWKNGAVPAVTLTESGSGVRVAARIEKGRLRLPLKAHQPVRLGPQ